MNIRRLATAVVAVAATAVLLVGIASAKNFAPWAPAQKIDEIFGNSSELNTAFIDGCPIQSPDGLSLYLASSRPRFAGDTRTDLDIWVARREQKRDPWGAPEHLGEPVNSTADDFCPTPIRSGGLFFVSRQALPGAADSATSTSPATAGGTAGASRSILPARLRARTARWTSRVPRT